MPQTLKDPDPVTPSSSSFVYPVRSLLTGIHAPVASLADHPRAHGANYFDQRFSLTDAAESIEAESTIKQHPIPDGDGKNESNFRHFPREDGESRSFITQPLDSFSSNSPVLETIAGPTGEPIPYEHSHDRDSDEVNVNSRRPEPISEAGAVALADGAYYASSDSGSTRSSLASAGLVHLAPIPRPESQSTNRSTNTSSRQGCASRSDRSGSQSSASGSGRMRNSATGSTKGSDSHGQLSSIRYSNEDVDSPEPLVTFRFEHVQMGNQDHHVIVGREGKLTKCEDEPIRVPGAVQGFGVLVALEEDAEKDKLIVRQVSENASELLGFSPQYLFSLDCFTQTLPESQADVLWDNIQFLNGPDLSEPEDTPDGPQVFLLSGWGEPGSAMFESDPAMSDRKQDRRRWTCWCAAHRSPSGPIILEFELERDVYNPLYPPYQSDTGASSGSSRGSGSAGSRSSAETPGSSTVGATSGEDSAGMSTSTLALVDEKSRLAKEIEDPISQRGLHGDDMWYPSAEDILESTTSHSKPLRALERMRRVSRDPASAANASKAGRKSRSRAGGIGTMDVFSVLAQVNDQLASARDLDTFLKVVVGVIKDLCQFHRVLMYQFDEMWNGQVVAELVDWNQSHDLFKNLHFPAADIPAQARELYCLNKVRLLYDRSQTTARLVVRDRRDLDPPLDMTHSYLRAMSPIHVRYLGNMGVRASMSISIVAFGALWGLIACHSYGKHGMRISFPVRQMLRLLSDSISRNIERLSYAQRLHTRKLISTLPTDSHPTGYIVSNAEDLLSLFDADFGVLVVGEGAKILGPNEHGQEILILAEYLRLRQFEMMQVSQAVTTDFPDLVLPTGLEVIAGLLYVPLSSGGKDFIALLRKGQMRDVHWAGKPFKDGNAGDAVLEPRQSFKMWSETIVGRCRAWTPEQLETAGVLALVYGKFIEVWRQKETALQTTQLTNLLLSNASHEVRTPLNHIINYLELALNGPLDGETRENLTRSHTASKGLLFTINDLLDLTRLESGNETSFNEPFDLRATIEEAVHLYRIEANRRGLEFYVDVAGSPHFVIGDSKKIRTVLGNLVANAIKYTSEGKVTIECHKFPEPPGLRMPQQIAVEIVVADTGCGMSETKLESMFREFEQVESASSKTTGLGLGLAVVARIIEQLGGQLRVDSKLNEGSRFSFLIPFALHDPPSLRSGSGASSNSSLSQPSRHESEGSAPSVVDSFVEALSTSFMGDTQKRIRASPSRPKEGTFPVEGSKYPVRSVKVDEFDLDKPHIEHIKTANIEPVEDAGPSPLAITPSSIPLSRLRVLVVDDDAINRTILSKRLALDGHEVMGGADGQEGVQIVETDMAFDCVLMDIQMPIVDGFEATRRIRALEAASSGNLLNRSVRDSFKLNGRIPVFAVSASLSEHQRDDMLKFGFDGWILKPIDFKRLSTILRGITDASERRSCLYHAGCNWEAGGWLTDPSSRAKTYPRISKRSRRG